MPSFVTRSLATLASLALLTLAQSSNAATLFVRASAAPGGNGADWASAFTRLEDALAAAQANPAVDQIWVAAGTYRPAPGPGDRTKSFVLINGVSVYGGFAGVEASLDARDWIANPTILSGDLSGNDGPNFSGNAENVYHVVRSNQLTTSVLLDGFTVQGGNADGAAQIDKEGSGFLANAAVSAGSISIRNCTFTSNVSTAPGGGGAVRIANAKTTEIRQCTFVANAATGSCAGLGIYSGDALVSECSFESNTATVSGGAMVVMGNNGVVRVVDCDFTSNSAVNRGGAVWYAASGTARTLRIENSSFTSNTTGTSPTSFLGGAIAGEGGRLLVVDSLFASNLARFEGGAIRLQLLGSSSTDFGGIFNCRFVGNTSVEKGGGATSIQTSGFFTVAGCEFSGNTSKLDGSAIELLDTDSKKSISNCSFVSNHSVSGFGAVKSASAAASIANCIFWGNSGASGTTAQKQINMPASATTPRYSIVQGWTTGGSQVSAADPLLIDADGSDDLIGTADDDLAVAGGSPAIDSGSNDDVPVDSLDADGDGNTLEQLSFGARGTIRFVDDPSSLDTGSGIAPLVDRGATEFGGAPSEATWIGPRGGAWGVAKNWSGGSVPDDRTNVTILGDVVISVTSAEALGVSIGAGGSLTVNGSLTCDSIDVDFGASLQIDGESAFLSAGSLGVAAGADLDWVSGTVEIRGGAWSSPASIAFGCADLATLILNDGSVIAPSIQICDEGILRGSGTLVGAVTNAGVVSPGIDLPGNGAIVVNGDYTQASTGVLEISLTDYRATGVDTLNVSGSLTRGGALSISLVPGFSAMTGGISDLVYATTYFGTWSIATPAPLGPYLWSVATIVGAPQNSTRLTTSISGVGPRLYVDDDAAPNGDGLSWSTAMNTLSSAMNAAAAFPGAVGEIWIAEGRHSPLTGSVPDPGISASFKMTEGTSLYGGFLPGATSLADADPVSYPTVIDADLLGNDGPPLVNRDDNVERLLRAESGNPWVTPTVVDGLVFRGSTVHGMFVSVATPTIRRCVFSECDSTGFGGLNGAGLFIGAGIRVEDCLFERNVTLNYGGGIGVGDVFVTPTILRCTFVENTSFENDGAGAAIGAASQSINIIDCTFLNNSVQGSPEGGGAVATFGPSANIVSCRFHGNSSRHAGGAVWMQAGKIINCVFTGNSAGIGFPSNSGQVGGAIATKGAVTISHCTIAGNSAQFARGGISTTQAGQTTTINNTILWNNSDPSGMTQAAQLGGPGSEPLSYTIVKGWSGSLGGVGNNGNDPLLTDLDGTDNVVGTIDDDVHVGSTSPAIDSGSNTATQADVVDLDGDGNLTEKIPFDADGNGRFADVASVPDTGAGTAPITDRGAFEFGSNLPPGEYVGPSGGDWFVASNWAGGQIPGPLTDVTIGVPVVVAGGNATAASVSIQAGGSLSVGAGAMTVGSLTVAGGGELALTAPTATVTVVNISLLAGAILDWSAGTIIVNGGALVSIPPLALGCEGQATLDLLAATVTAPALSICEFGEVRGDGTISAPTVNAGVISPGGAPPAQIGTLTFGTSLSQLRAGSLLLDLDGTDPGIDVDLVVAASMMLNGSLELRVARGFEPALTFTNVLTADSVTGNFGSIVVTGSDAVMTATSNGKAVLVLPVPLGPILYVNASTPTNGDGSSWLSATADLQAALVAAEASSGAISEVWVAAGRYAPYIALNAAHASAARTATFEIPAGLSLLGGFGGWESFAFERDPDKNLSHLSGDIVGDDLSDGPGGTADNAFNVLVATGSGATATVDGFLVSGGVADDNGAFETARGAGFRIEGRNLSIARCRFDSNVANDGGAAIAVSAGANVDVDDCVFNGNRSGDGGAISVYGASSVNVAAGAFWFNRADLLGGAIAIFDASTLDAVDVAFLANEAGTSGGAIHADAGSVVRVSDALFESQSASIEGGAVRGEGASLTFTHTTFLDNVVGIRGGGVHVEGGELSMALVRFLGNRSSFRGGGMFVDGAPLRVDGCLLSGNNAEFDGGAMVVKASSSSIANTTAASNESVLGQGGGIYAEGGTMYVHNSILALNRDVSNAPTQSAQITAEFTSVVVEWSTLEGWTGGLGGTGNNGAAPNFISPSGADGVAGTTDDNLRLTFASPGVDSGSNALLPSDTFDVDGDADVVESLPIDLDGTMRRLDSPPAPDVGSGSAPIVDRGAYEFIPGCPGCPGDSVWIDPSGGSFVDVGNWYPDVPSSPAGAVFTLPATYSVALSSPRTCERLEVNRGSVTFAFGGGSLALQSPTDAIRIGLTDPAPASLTLTGGTVTAGASTLGGSSVNAQLNVAGGSIAITGQLGIGAGGPATLSVTTPGVISAGAVSIGSQGRVEGAGAILAPSTINLGAVSPGGEGIGTLFLSGTYLQGGGAIESAGQLQIDVAGAAIDQHDSLIVGGAATLSGVLVVSFEEGTSFAPGTEVTILQAPTISGSFQQVLLPPVENGVALTVQYVDGATDRVTLVALAVDTDLFSFASPTVVSGIDEPTAGVLRDRDGDGDLDLFVLSHPPEVPGVNPVGALLYYRNLGVAGSTWLGFAAAVSTPTLELPSALGFGDFDGDGDEDVAVANRQFGRVLILREDGDSLANAGVIDVPDYALGVAAGTFYDGNRDDLVVMTSQSRQRLFDNLGVPVGGPLAEAFAPTEAIIAGTGGTFVATTDLDGDGVDEILAAHAGADDNGSFAQLSVLGRGAGTVFEVLGVYPTGVGAKRLSLADVTGDGALDILTANLTSDSITLIAATSSDSTTLGSPITFQSGDAPSSVAAADFDSDGDDDLVIAAGLPNGGRGLRLKRNNLGSPGQPLFSDASPVETGAEAEIVLVGDVDSDGKPDLVSLNRGGGGVAAGIGNTVTVHRNTTELGLLGDLDGDGFVNGSDLAILLGAWGGSSTADLNGDGVVDGADLATLLGAWTG